MEGVCNKKASCARLQEANVLLLDQLCYSAEGYCSLIKAEVTLQYVFY